MKNLKKLTISHIFLIFKLQFGFIFRPNFDKTLTGRKWQTLANLDFFHDERSLSPLSGGTCPIFGKSWQTKPLKDKVHCYPSNLSKFVVMLENVQVMGEDVGKILFTELYHHSSSL